MNTTCMRDSVVGDAWIQESVRLNPPAKVYNDKNEFTGNITSGPVRLAFCDSLFEAKPAMRTDKTSALKYQATLLFTPFHDLSLFWEEYYRIAGKDFGSHFDAGTNQYHGLDNPITDGASKLKYGGFTPGCMTLNASSNFKPPVVDNRNMVITNPTLVYAGCWAIVALNSYASGKMTPRKGPRFGIQTVMKIGDDTPLAGGGLDPRLAFKGINVRPPVAVPTAAFGQPNPGVAPPPPGAPMGAIYGAQGHGPTGMPGHAPPPPRAGVPPLPTGRPADDEDPSQFL